ncbi:hypothetical protein TNCV_2910501 [Trichonephila clavipes]|nr:hypothetical protein TNCV_2910501 [Trichonephila clavipes]
MTGLQPIVPPIDVRDYLNRKFARWIDSGEPIACPPRSTDLSPLYFFFWRGGFMKYVCETLVDNKTDLVARIVAAAGIVHDMIGGFENIRGQCATAL